MKNKDPLYMELLSLGYSDNDIKNMSAPDEMKISKGKINNPKQLQFTKTK